MSDAITNSAQKPLPLYAQASPQDISSASSSATALPGSLTPGPAGSNSDSTGRPPAGSGGTPSQQTSFPPLPNSRHSGYAQNLYSKLASPAVSLPGYQEFSQASASHTGLPSLISNAHMTAATLQGQKRAYRQRRKDPSCDACRERKVKCDATDSSSCTECSSRNVRCQFTKETNRRMSNIRHNQDLQKELVQAKAQVEHLRTMLERGKAENQAYHASVDLLPVPEPADNHKLSHLPDPGIHHSYYAGELFSGLEQRQPKRRKTTAPVEYFRIGHNMQRYGRGIFKPPYPRHEQPGLAFVSGSLPLLPAKHEADVLLRQYQFTIHPTLPMIHWPSFQKQYDTIYAYGSLEKTPRIWIALLYAVFACGTLHRSWQEGKQYLEISRSMVDLWTEDFVLDHVRTALLNSMFLVEMNCKSAGWTYIGCAVRMAFDIGLHCEAGAWASIDEEMRRRVWWCIYSCDNLLALELGRPALIKEEDCMVNMPSPVSDHYMHENIDWTMPTPEQSKSPLLPMIQVIGGIAKLLRMLKSRCLGPSVLEAYDTHFNKSIQAFPAMREDRPNQYLDPVELPPMIYLQNARLMLFRHNLSPSCEAYERCEALDKCVAVARDTAHLLSRGIQESPMQQSHPSNETGSWETRMVSAVSAFFCSHIWRCTLFLCFRGDYENALWCARTSAALGRARPINTACGCYLEFFLYQLLDKRSRDVQLDSDEELLAYVSGDLQGSFENSWIWKTSKSATTSSSPDKITRYQPGSSHGAVNTDLASEHDLEAHSAEWSGWENVLNILKQLFHEQQDEQQRREIVENKSLRPPMILPPLAPPPIWTSSSNRISIRDLI